MADKSRFPHDADTLPDGLQQDRAALLGLACLRRAGQHPHVPRLLCVQYVMTYVRHLSVYYAIISFFGIWTAVSVAYIRGSRYIIAVLIMTTVLALCALVATLAAKIAAGYESNASFCAIL